MLIPRYQKPVPFRNRYFYHKTIFNPVMSGDKPADNKPKDIMPKTTSPKLLHKRVRKVMIVLQNSENVLLLQTCFSTQYEYVVSHCRDHYNSTSRD